MKPLIHYGRTHVYIVYRRYKFGWLEVSIPFKEGPVDKMLYTESIHNCRELTKYEICRYRKFIPNTKKNPIQL